jgi:phage FluMu protein Com
MRDIKLFFRCKSCGEVSVDLESFKKFIPDWLRFRLKVWSDHTVVKAVISFEDKCPKCKLTNEGYTEGKSHAQVILVHEKKNKAGISKR